MTSRFPEPGPADVVVIGGGQAGLAAGFYLRRTGLDFVILDAQDEPGGAWQHAWPSLRLFSPAHYSSLPGRPMPTTDGYPSAAHVVDYLTAYEKRYDLPLHRPVHVEAVHRRAHGLRVDTDHGSWTARRVISATCSPDSWPTPACHSTRPDPENSASIGSAPVRRGRPRRSSGRCIGEALQSGLRDMSG